MPATQRQIAQKAGVSVTTVSFVLSGCAREKKVNRDTEQRVLQIARQMGYQGNYHAQALATGRSNTLGLLLDLDGAEWPQHRYWGPLLSGIAAEAGRQGQDLLLIGSRADASSALELAIRSLHQQRIDGLLVLSERGGIARLLPRDQAIIPVAPSCPDLDSGVLIDDAPGVRAAVDHLAGLGHRRILHLTRGGDRKPLIPARSAAYRAAMRACGLRPAEAFIAAPIPYHADLAEQIEAYARALGPAFALPRDATAVLCYNDNMALALYDLCARRGLRVPEDLSIVGFDNGASAAALPPMTTIDHMLPEMGTQAVNLLLKRIAGHTTRACTIRVAAKLVVRRSTGIPRDRES